MGNSMRKFPNVRQFESHMGFEKCTPKIDEE